MKQPTEYAREILPQIFDWAKKHDIKLFLDHGTLLKLHRQSELRLEDDIDITYFATEHDLIQQHANNFPLELTPKKNPKHGWTFSSGELVALTNFHHMGCYAPISFRITFIIPKIFYDQPDTITWYGYDYPCPGPIDIYMQWLYGPGWRDPMTAKEYETYQREVLYNDRKPYPANRPNVLVQAWFDDFIGRKKQSEYLK